MHFSFYQCQCFYCVCGLWLCQILSCLLLMRIAGNNSGFFFIWVASFKCQSIQNFIRVLYGNSVSFFLPTLHLSVKAICPIISFQNNLNCYTSEPPTRSMYIRFQKVMKSLELAVSCHLGRSETEQSGRQVCRLVLDTEPHIGLLVDLCRKQIQKVISEQDRNSFS